MRALAIVLVVCAAATAYAQPAAAPASSPLGEKGTWILTAERLVPLLSYSKDSEDVGNNDSGSVSRTSLSFFSYLVQLPDDAVIAYTIPRISLDYTVAPNITIGGSIFAFVDLSSSQSTTIGGTTTNADNPKATAFGITPRIGYVMSLGPKLALWPRAGFSYYTESVSNPPNGGGNNTTDGFHQFALDLEGNFAAVLAPHFFVLFGPVIDIPLSGSVSTTNGGTTVSNDNSQFHFGITGGLGGYF